MVSSADYRRKLLIYVDAQDGMGGCLRKDKTKWQDTQDQIEDSFYRECFGKRLESS